MISKMKTDIFFEEIKNRTNIYLIEKTDEIIKSKFESKYNRFKDDFFYSHWDLAR